MTEWKYPEAVVETDWLASFSVFDWRTNKNGKMFTYDINTNTNYNSIAEKYSKKKGMQVVARFLKKELIKIN